MPEVLECWLHGDHVGRFERQTGRAARLVYDADATRVVSLSLPIDAPAPDGAAEHYLRGLLPEDPVALRDMMRASDAASTDTFELLRQVGGDVAGAVQLTAPGSEPGSDPDHEPLIASTADIGARIAGIKARPTASAFAGDWPLRFSLAGVQAKFALARIGGSWYRPDAHTPSTGEFAARYSNLGKAVRQIQRYMTRNTDEACLDTVRPETPLTGRHDHRFEDGSDAVPEAEK